MTVLSVTIPDAVVSRVVDAVAYGNGYNDFIIDPANPVNQIPNPMTKAQFAKNILKDWIKANVITYEAAKAADIARQNAIDDVNSDVTIGD